MILGPQVCSILNLLQKSILKITSANTRVTSIYCLSLLDYVLGATVFVNCKSGLDRTGIYTAASLGVIALWELYPGRRWDIHLSLINFNVLRGRFADANMLSVEMEEKGEVGGRQGMVALVGSGVASTPTISSPSAVPSLTSSTPSASAVVTSSPSPLSTSSSPSPLSASTSSSLSSFFCPSSDYIASILEGGGAGLPQGLRTRNSQSPSTTPTPTPKEMVEGRGGGSDGGGSMLLGSDWIFVSDENVTVCLTASGEVMEDGRERNLVRLAPFVGLLRNFIYCFLMEMNSVVTLASSGVRGHKYRHHALLGHLIPPFVKKENGDLITLLAKSHMTRVIALTKEGENQLVDCSFCRKS